MNHIKYRLFLFLFLFFNSVIINGAPIPIINYELSTPGKSDFLVSNEYIRPYKEKKLTWIDYFTDQFILYGSLWLSIGTTVPIWETVPVFINGPNAAEMFTQRVQLEPFVSGRIDQFVKPLVINGTTIKHDWGEPVTVLTRDFYAKNLIEPAFFTWMGLYLKAKNYHPALIIAELFTMSLIYEFTIRPLFMNASFEQLLKNPAIGAAFSILLDELSTFLLTTPYTALHVLAYILNPFKLLPNAKVTSLLFFKSYQPSVSLETIITF